MILQSVVNVKRFGYNKCMTSKHKKWLLCLLIIMIVYFGFRGSLFLDPDFGWHLMMGRFILTYGIPPTDPFSYTMSSYPFVDHEWLMNIFFAKAMDIVGYTVLAGIFAVFAVVAFALQIMTVSAKAKQFALPFLFLALLVASGFIGIRPQIITWFFFSVVLIVIRDFTLYEKFRWWLPLLFVLWVNLHGGFAVGIVALFLATAYWCYKNPSKWRGIVSVFVASIAATFVMPYGWRGWWEVAMQMTDGNLRWTIMEWTPSILVPSMQLWLFIVFSAMFIGRYVKKFSLLDILLYGGLLAATISSIRHAPLWLLIALPLTIEAVALFYQEITKIKFAVKRFTLMAKLFLGLVFLLVLFDIQGILYAFGFFGKQTTYPDKAVSYVKMHLPQGQVFSTYDWGGYLIWKLPEKKVYIDGRMPSWRWEANIPNESNYAFDDYRKFAQGKIPFDSEIQKYGIAMLLLPLPVEAHKNPVDTMLMNFVTNVLHLPLEQEVGYTKIVKAAKKAGWEVVYKDDTAVVYKKK
jgi:hypothetical protein